MNLENENGPIAHRKVTSQIDGTDEMEEFRRCISAGAPKIEKGKQVGARNEFVEEWDKRLEEWGKNGERNLENPVDEYDINGNRELDGEKGK